MEKDVDTFTLVSFYWYLGQRADLGREKDQRTYDGTDSRSQTNLFLLKKICKSKDKVFMHAA